MPNTGFKSPTANGETYNEWTNPEQAYSSNDSWADAPGSVEQDYYNFNFGIPAGALIDGIEVSIEAKADVNGGGTIDIMLNGEAGGWTVAKQQSWPGDGTEYTRIYGGSTDVWGGPQGGGDWDSDDFTDGNFRLRCDSFNPGSNHIDHVQVKIYYTEYLADNKSVNGVVKADIKSINSVLAGDIKNIN